MRSYFWPKTIVWETTLRCNMRCLHCGSIAGEAREGELNTAESLNLAQQLVDMGAETIILSGGETLMRDDWQTLANFLVDEGITLGIITNGVTLDKNARVIGQLKELYDRAQGGFSLGLSIDGMEQSHDEIRGIPGSFRQVIRGLTRCHEEGVPVVILTTVNQRNLADLRPLRDLMFQLKPYAWQFQTCSVYGRMKERRDWLLDAAQYQQLVEFLAESRTLSPCDPRIDPADCIGYYGPTEALLRDPPWQGCQAGIRSLGIESNGNIKGCLSLLDPVFIEGNIRAHSLAEIWDNPKNFAYNREFSPDKLAGMCAGCEHGRACVAGCRGVAHSVTGNFWQAPYCIHGQARAADVKTRQNEG